MRGREGSVERRKGGGNGYRDVVGDAVDGVFDGGDGVVERLGGGGGVVELKLIQELFQLYILGIDAIDASRTHHPLLPR